MLMLAPMMLNVVWADEVELTKRVERLERMIKSQGLTSLMGKVDQLQNEVQRLNGENESLRHELTTMEKRQRELYLDLEQQLQSQSQPTIAPAPIAVAPEIITNEQSAEADLIRQTETEAELPVAPEETAAVDSSVTTESIPDVIDNGDAAYQAALQTLRSGQYEQAIIALAAFP